MQRARILLFSGIWVAILPYLGFPSSWKSILFTLSGLGFIYFGYILHKESRAGETGTKTFDNFSENQGFSENKMEDRTSGESVKV